MGNDVVEYFNRYSGRIETEEIYGEGFLRWTYGNPLGRLALEGWVKRALFSQWYGARMDAPGSRRKTAPFIARYGLKAEEFADPPESFRTFNEFFYRKLKPGARPIAAGQGVAIFPADGRHLGFQDVSAAPGIFVKGATLSLAELFQSRELAARYAKGSMVLSRLCPVDYHRFHFPVAGTPGTPVKICGPLYSVNPLALRRNIRYLTENKRHYTLIQSPEFGQVAMFEVGATCVGRIEYTFVPGAFARKGDEKGFFKFGGSETITLFEPGAVRLAPDLVENSAIHRELYARMGDELGRKAE